MKKLIYLLFTLIPFISLAQNKIEASRILEQLNKGEAVTYQDAEISGDLDFTRLQNMNVERGKDGEDDNSHYSAVSTVKSPIRFINCRFTGDVLGHIGSYQHSWNGNHKKPDTTFSANFEEEVVFESCRFDKASAFKYSKFAKSVSFAKSIFNKEALFKYSKFAKGPNFSSASFEEGANFKYADFPKGVDFSAASFNKEADFKYAKFLEGVNFSNTTFNNYANFKYARFSQPLNITGVSFGGNEDFKYASVDGISFTSYILDTK